MSDGTDDTVEQVPQELVGDFRALLGKLSARYNFDFREYKETSLARRIRARMAQVHVDSFATYSNFLDGDSNEHVALFNTILINVTTFFRDPDAWKALAEDVIPKVVDEVGDTRSIRIWSAGCSSGEEPYSSTSARRRTITPSRSTAPTSTRRRSRRRGTRCTEPSSSKTSPTDCWSAISPATVSSIGSAATSAAGASSAVTT